MKIPATVITGFLGAGKTTLIRHLLATANGARLALIINEFGDLGIDRELIVGCPIAGCDENDVIELANGCICCTVADDFLPTIETLLARVPPPDHIVIEASGLALPKPLVKAFNWPEVRARVTVSGVITVIDAPAVAAGLFAADPEAVNARRLADPTLDHDQPLREVFEDQLNAADLVLLNKSDLLDACDLEKVKAGIAPALPAGARVVTTVKGGLDPRVALGLGVAAEDAIDGRRSHHDDEADHDHDDFESFVVRFGRVLDPKAVEDRVRACARDFDVLRVKGFLCVEGKDVRHVLQAVGPRVDRYYDRPWKPGEARASALVVIGERGLDRAAIESLLKG